MQELRFVAVSEDGRYAVLAVPGRSARFTLPIDERLRAVALGQTSRLTQYEIEVESPLRPKEIQARIRAGETVEEIADAAGIAVERVRWFEAPILAERAYAAGQAQLASVRRQGDATPGPRLGEIVTERLKLFGADPEDAQWDAKKLGDGSWQVQLTFISGGRLHTAEWHFDPRRRHVLPADDNAARMSLPGTEPPQPAAPAPGEATITQLAPRLTSASGQGGPIHSAPGYAAPTPAGADYGPGFGQPGASAAGFGPAGNGTPGFGPGKTGIGNGPVGGNGAIGNSGRPRHERPGSGRPPVPQPQVPQPQVPEPQVPEPQVGEHHVAEPQVAEPVAPEPRRAEAPAAVASSGPSTPLVSPAAVAAQVSRVPQTPQPGRTSPPAGAPQPERMAQPGRTAQPERGSLAAQESQPARETRTAEEARVAQAGQQTAAASSSAADSSAAATRAAASPSAPAQEAPSASSPSAEPASEQSARQGRKAARGKRSSVPSWDEIMFGSSRQRE
jgi:Protein of unknown function (DUF3071)